MASLRKLKQGNQTVYQIDYVDSVTGRRHRKNLRCDYRTAQAVLRGIETKLAQKEFGLELLHETPITFETVCERYLVRSERTKASETTKREDLVIRTFKNFVGNPFVSTITPSLVENYIDTRLKKDKVSSSTVAIELRILRAIFNQAIRWKMIKENPINQVTFPKNNDIKVRFLRLAEIEDLLEVIPDGDFKRLVIGYLNTGARRKELLPENFNWKNVDFEQKKIFLKGKGDKGRYVPMNDTFYRILKLQSDAKSRVPFDFKPDTVSHKLARYYEDAGIEGANVHSLRKTFGSILIQNKKIDLYVVSRLLGHSSIRTTEKYYVDLLDENYHESVKQLDDLLPSSSENDGDV